MNKNTVVNTCQTSIQYCDNVFTGHSAKFGSYTTMDLNTNTVVDLQLVQVGLDEWNFTVSFSCFQCCHDTHFKYRSILVICLAEQWGWWKLKNGERGPEEEPGIVECTWYNPRVHHHRPSPTNTEIPEGEQHHTILRRLAHGERYISLYCMKLHKYLLNVLVGFFTF